MKLLRISGAFKKDWKRCARRGGSFAKLETVINQLREGKKLPQPAQPHPLKGAWKGHWDCHIEPDWVLIYKVNDEEILLARTGTHADLFGR